MAKLKGINKINKYLNKWLKENSFDCTVELGTDFSYNLMEDTIYYALVIPSDYNNLFLKVCQECREEIGNNIEPFIISFFHELGHFETQDIFEEYEWESYNKLCSKSEIVDEKLALKYFHHPIELSATQWGCDYIIDNAEKVKKWWEGLQPLILEFYKKNNIQDI